jgi:hypothetical protein
LRVSTRQPRIKKRFILVSLEESVAFNHPLRSGAALLAIVFLCVGCRNPVTPSTDTRTTAQKALDSLTGFEFPTLTGSTNDLSSLSTSFKVPVLTADGVYALSWTATPMTYFKKIDPLSGQIFVAIPDSVTADTPVTLTVTAIPTASRSAAEVSGTEGATKDYSVVIHPIADTATAVAAVLGGLSGNLLDFSGKDDVDHVSGNFELPSVGSFGTEVEWVLATPAGSRATTVGGLTLTPGNPATGAPASVTVITSTTTSSTATLTPTVKKKGGSGATGTPGTPITITVPTITAQQKVDLDAAALPELVANALVKAGKGDTIAAITSDFTLPLSGDRGTTLAWAFTTARATTGPVAYTPASGAVLVTPAATDTSLALAGTISMADANPKTITIKVKVKGGGGSSGTGSNSISVVVTDPTTPGTSASLSFLDPGSVAITSYTLKKGHTQALNASFEATSYSWYIDGITGTSLSSTASCNVDSTNLGYGRHFLFLEATGTSIILSGSIAIDVVPLPEPGLAVTVALPAAGSSVLTFQDSAAATITTIIIRKTTPVEVKTSFAGSSFAWYLDNDFATKASTTATCTVDAASLGYGRHSLTLEAKVGDIVYSGTLPFDVGAVP